MPDTVFFYAAGLGTRMRPLTDARPKPLIEVVGKSLLDHAIDLANDAKIERRAINVHYLAGQIEAHPSVAGMTILDERNSLLETGGGLRKAAGVLGDAPLFTMNTDAIWRGANPFDALARRWNPQEMDALLLLVPTGNAVGYKGSGDFELDTENRLSRGSGYVYSGCQIINPNRLREIDEVKFSTNLYWDLLAESGRLFGTVYDGQWCDVGQPESIALAEAMLAGSGNV